MTATYGQTIKGLGADQSAVLTKVEAGGSLEVRRLRTGAVVFYWRHTRSSRTERVPIGSYDPAAPPRAIKPTGRGFSVTAALERARDLAKQDQEAPGGLRGLRERMKTEQAEQVRLTSQKAKYTLGALLLEYCNWLELQGKGSHREARNVFKNHVQEAAPDLWAAPAALVDRRQINEPVRKLAEAGMRPTARKLRSYLRAAYACAVHADSDANLPAAFIPFGVTLNPVEATAAVKTIGTDKNPLNLQELRDYWSALQDEPGERGAALRLLLLTGAQRVAQLARVRAPEDVRQDAIRILDTKGRRQEPRIHLVPITKAMRRELALLSPVGFVLSTDRGKTPMHATSLSAWASDVGTRAGIQGFQLKRVRSAVETELARTGVGKDIRGQLQSHGLGGIQERHYDAYEYMREKREGVDALYELLTHKGPRQKTAKKALRRKSPVGSEVI